MLAGSAHAGSVRLDTDMSPAPLLELDLVQARVLGSLVEKASTTPETYPLTLNALVVACNQKTSREPVMELEPGAAGHAVRQLEDCGLVKVVHGARALRYEHRFDEVYTVTARQRAVLCLLLLRGPQTLGELLVRSERLAAFPSIDDVRDTLERLAGREPPMALCVGRAPGQREDRYMHLLCGAVAARAAAAGMSSSTDASATASIDHDAMAARLAELESRVAALEAGLAELRANAG
jgi:uncharacterized protein YceH (UPF0502 family)